jgi:CheY-like chemotaxis protein/CRP-like cAMP-binding protein
MKKILLIEDNPDMRENTAEILELADYEVTTAENGKEGVRAAKEAKPDLILCDVMMPEMDGFGVLRMLGRDPETSHIPFIFLTAKTEMADMRKGMNLGADDYLTKPYDEVELLDAIEMRLKKGEIIHKEFDHGIDGLNQFFNEARSMEALSDLSKDREIRYFRPKDIIFAEDSFPTALYYVVKGKVKTYKTNEDAKDFIINLFKHGDFFGYTPLLTNQPHVESAMALEDTELAIIPKEDFFALVYNNRDVANRFIRMISQSLMNKKDHLMHLAYDTVRKRVADALLTLQDRYQKEGSTDFSMKISRENLASMVGTSKECVIRVLSEFKQDKMIVTDLSEITIIDHDKLSQVRY